MPPPTQQATTTTTTTTMMRHKSPSGRNAQPSARTMSGTERGRRTHLASGLLLAFAAQRPIQKSPNNNHYRNHDDDDEAQRVAVTSSQTKRADLHGSTTPNYSHPLIIPLLFFPVLRITVIGFGSHRVFPMIRTTALYRTHKCRNIYHEPRNCKLLCIP